MTWLQRYRVRHYIANSIWLSVTASWTKRFFTEPEDRALAAISDLQGVGGKQGRSQPNRQVEEATLHDH